MKVAKKTHNYRVIELLAQDADGLAAVINRWARRGWRLVGTAPGKDAYHIKLILERPVCLNHPQDESAVV